MKLKLKEVLWEITPHCNRSCAFCGSKDIVNVQEQLIWDDILYIARNIASNCETIILSGGEPLTIGVDKLKEIKTICDNYNTNLDVVTNGDILSEDHAGIFRNIGISINSYDDIVNINTDVLAKVDSEIVFITNINKINDFELDAILAEANSIRKYHSGFQFQLTMYKDDNIAKIDGDDIEILRNYIIDLCETHKMPFILADNLQATHDCTAGINSCGVLFNGDVVACLSERSWNDDYEIHGNILAKNLDEIWRTGFSRQRFDDFEGCRGCFNYKQCSRNANKNNPDILLVEPYDLNKIVQYPPSNPYQPQVVLYGVYTPPTYVYGVFTPNDKWEPNDKWNPNDTWNSTD